MKQSMTTVLAVLVVAAMTVACGGGGSESAGAPTGGGQGAAAADLTAPTLLKASTDATGDKISLTYSEALHGNVPAINTFAVSTGAGPIPVTGLALSGSTVVLTLAASIGQAQTVTVSYRAPAADGSTSNAALQDMAGNDAIGLNQQAVSNVVSKPDVAGSDPIDRYIGTWTAICDTYPEDDVRDSNGKGLSVTQTLAINKASATLARYTYTVKVFASDDPFCKGTPTAQIILTGGGSQNLSVSGTTLTSDLGVNELRYLAAQNLASETVDRIAVSKGQAGQGSSAIAVGTVIIPAGSIFQVSDSFNALVKFTSSTQYLLNRIEGGVIPSKMEEDEYLIWSKQP